MLTSGHIDLSYEAERELLHYLYELSMLKLQLDRKIAACQAVVRDVRQGRLVQKRVALARVTTPSP